LWRFVLHRYCRYRRNLARQGWDAARPVVSGDVAVREPAMEIARIVGAERSLKGRLAVAVCPHCRSIVAGKDRSAGSDVGARIIQHLLDGVAERGQIAAVDLHQTEVDAVTLRDVASGELRRLLGVGRAARLRCPPPG